MIELKNKYKAVFFDFGGVITSSPFLEFNKYEKKNNLPLDIIRNINSKNPDKNAWALLEKGMINIETFNKKFQLESEKFGFKISGIDVIELVFGKVRPEMLDLVDRVKKKYLTACLTNNFNTKKIDVLLNNLSESYIVAKKKFDCVIESSTLKFRKPELKFYDYSCKLLKVKPEEVIFLDDLGINLKPARQLGMTTIKVSSSTQAITDLLKLIKI